ncbi:MAG: hypothetical protein KH142_01975 [Slackia piriformis]|uniref:Uncharacterized protein n=1 Tax=Slackia piriformis TaxID=626934 RepID=A0A943YXR4_9ACTN|nr:hypothetical protein [Slackia piriformis]
MGSVTSTFKSVGGIVGLVLLFTSFGLIAIGEWAPSIGIVGLLRNICTASAFVLFAVSFVGMAFVFMVNMRRERVRKGEAFAVIAGTMLREALRFLVACLAYGGSAFIALGVLVAFGEGEPSPERLLKLVVVVAACIGVVVLYRRYRKRHPVKYEMLGQAGVLLMFFLLTLLGVFIGATLAKDAVLDLMNGPKTELCWLAEVDENHATGRYSGFRQDSLDLTFRTLDDRDIHIDVAEGDRAGLSDVVDAEGVVWLTYFPESGVFVSADAGLDDYLAVGGE